MVLDCEVDVSTTPGSLVGSSDGDGGGGDGNDEDDLTEYKPLRYTTLFESRLLRPNELTPLVTTDFVVCCCCDDVEDWTDFGGGKDLEDTLRLCRHESTVFLPSREITLSVGEFLPFTVTDAVLYFINCGYFMSNSLISFSKASSTF